MAQVKRQVAKKAPPKAPKPTKAQINSLEYQYIGHEPVDISIKGYTSALNWYTYEKTEDDAFSYVMHWMETNGFSKEDIQAVKAAPKYTLPNTAGWIARMLSNGNEVDSIGYLQNKITEAIQKGKAAKALAKEEAAKTKDSANVVSIQDRTKAVADSLITDIEEALDQNGLGFALYEFLVGKEAKPAHVGHVKTFYQRHLDEVMSGDEQVKEAFGKDLKPCQTFWTKFHDDLDRFVGNVKAAKPRVQRAKKIKASDQLVKDLKFQKEFPPLKIVSINPADIIGAKQLWLYDTKNNNIRVLEAEANGGLTVKGTTITGFDPKKSIKKTARKPEEVTRDVLGATKVSLRKYLDTLTTKASEAIGRTNEDTILLRVVR